MISNTTFQNVHVEAADTTLIDLDEDRPPTFRTAANLATIKDAFFTNVSSDVKSLVNLHGSSATVNIVGVHFNNFTVQDKAITSQTDADATWSINSFVSNITFQ